MKLALTIVLIILSIALTIIVLMQEGKGQGLSSSLGGGNTDTYWSKNKGRSKDAVIAKITVVLAILFMAVSVVLSSKWM